MKITSIVALILFLTTCDDNTQQDCRDIMCTQIFVNYNLSITDPSNNPYPLDSIQVSELLSGDNLTIDYSDLDLENMQKTGLYPLYSDIHVKKHQSINLDIVFKGFVGQTVVVNQVYNVGADCCHVRVNSGDLNIIIN